MTQPPSFSTGQSNVVCKLNKSLYALRQAPCAWFDKLASTLLSFGFVNACSDSFLFIRCSDTSTMYILVYVDDIIITGSDSATIASIKLLHNQFALKDLGPLHYFLGIHVD